MEIYQKIKKIEPDVIYFKEVKIVAKDNIKNVDNKYIWCLAEKHLIF